MDNHQIITEDQIPKDGLVYDPSGGEVNLPNVDRMLDDIYKVLEASLTEEMVQLKKTDDAEYKAQMEEKFPQFAFRYYAIFLKLLSGEDITPLLEMLVQIEKVQSGEKTIEQAEKELGEQLAEQYIYPKVGKTKKKKNRR